jgi:hypothetical protein
MEVTPAFGGEVAVELLERLRLPPPVRWEPFGRPGRHRRTRLVFPDGARHRELVWVEVVASPPWDTLATEQVALSLVRQAGADDGHSLPVVDEYHLLHGLPQPTALHPLAPGLGADELTARVPAAAPLVARALGRVLAGMPAAPWPRAATRAAPGVGFVPTHPRPRDEVLARARAVDLRARALGADLGPLSDALLARVADGSPDSVPGGWRLVHGALSPAALRVSPDGPGDLQVTGVLDWSGARLGDPLADWATAWMSGPEVLRAAVDGYGREAAAAVLRAPGAGERVASHAAALCLQRLATLAEVPGSASASARARVVDLARRALGDVGADLRSVFDAGAGPAPAGSPARPGAVAALGRLAAVPLPVPTEAAVVVGALALDALAGEGAPAADGGALLAALARPCSGVPSVPVDRPAALDELRRRSAARWEAAALVWLVGRALDSLDGAAPDAALHGAAAMVEALLLRASEPTGADQLAAAVVAWAAGSATERQVGAAFDLVSLSPPTAAPLPAWPPAGWTPQSDGDVRRLVVRVALGSRPGASFGAVGAGDVLGAL